MERPPSLIYGNWKPMVLFHGMDSRHIVPLSSMVFHNTWYGPKEHCNNVIKRFSAFSIKNSSIFGTLHLSYSIELLGYFFWVIFLLWFERWGSKNPLWASPIHVTYLLYVSFSRLFIAQITLSCISHSWSIMLSLLLLSWHPSLSGLRPQYLDHTIKCTCWCQI